MKLGSLDWKIIKDIWEELLILFSTPLYPPPMSQHMERFYCKVDLKSIGGLKLNSILVPSD